MDNGTQGAASAAPRRRGRPELVNDPQVRAWVRKLMVRGWTRDRIVAASKAGTDGWPRKDGSLSNGAITAIRQALQIESGIRKPVRTARPPKSQRLRGTDKMTTIVIKFTSDLLNVIPALDIEAPTPEDLSVLLWARDNLIDMDVWCSTLLGQIQKYVGDQGIRDKIASMRNTAGRTAEEAEAFRAYADELERKLDSRLTA